MGNRWLNISKYGNRLYINGKLVSEDTALKTPVPLMMFGVENDDTDLDELQQIIGNDSDGLCLISIIDSDAAKRFIRFMSEYPI